MCIAPWEKRWVVKESNNGRLKSSALQFSSVHVMLTHITISARWNSKAATQRRRFRNLRLRCGCRRTARNSIRNWLMPTQRLCDRQTHRKRWKPTTCSGNEHEVAPHRLRLPLPSNDRRPGKQAFVGVRSHKKRESAGLTSWVIFSSLFGTRRCSHALPRATSWATLSRPSGTQFGDGSSHTDS